MNSSDEADENAEVLIIDKMNGNNNNNGSVITGLLIACVMFVSFLGFVAYIVKTKENQKRVLSISMNDRDDSRRSNAG